MVKNLDNVNSPQTITPSWINSVLNNQTTPPTNPNDGDRYRVIATATGAWTGKENNFAIWDESTTSWYFEAIVEPMTWYDYTAQQWHYMSHAGIITQFDKIPLAESDVTGLVADLAALTPLATFNAHKSRHVSGAADAFVGGDLLDATARSNVLQGGTQESTRRGINFISGTNITVSVVDNAGAERADVTINSSGGGGSFLDSVFQVENATDNTKVLKIDASVIPTGTSRTAKAPVGSGTLSTIENAETFSGVKTHSVEPVFNAGIMLGTVPNIDGTPKFTGTITSSKVGDAFIPSADNQGNIGNASFRWALVRAVAVTTGDLILSDRKTKKILYVIDEDKNGIYFSNYKTGKCLMKLDNRGNLHVSGKILTGQKLAKRKMPKKTRSKKKC